RSGVLVDFQPRPIASTVSIEVNPDRFKADNLRLDCARQEQGNCQHRTAERLLERHNRCPFFQLTSGRLVFVTPSESGPRLTATPARGRSRDPQVSAARSASGWWRQSW